MATKKHEAATIILALRGCETTALVQQRRRSQNNSTTLSKS